MSSCHLSIRRSNSQMKSKCICNIFKARNVSQRPSVAPSVQRRKAWLTPTTRVPCSNAAKTRTPLKFGGVPQTPEPISAVSGTKFTILSARVEEVLLLNNFFSDCRYMPSLRRYGPTNLCDGAEMAIFCVLYLQRTACSAFQTCILNSH